jgi:hypothetical protein
MFLDGLGCADKKIHPGDVRKTDLHHVAARWVIIIIMSHVWCFVPFRRPGCRKLCACIAD